MFKTIKFRALTNSEFSQCVKMLVDTVEAANADSLKIKRPYEALVQMHARLHQARKQEKAYAETQAIRRQDALRSSRYKGFTLMVQGLSNAGTPARQEAADQIRVLLRSAGKNVLRLNYQAKTEVLSTLVSTLSANPKYVAAVATLGLQEWITSIDAGNRSFEDLFKTRYTSMSEGAEKPSFGLLKKQTIPLIEDLFSLIASRLKTCEEDGTNTEAYQQLINKINLVLESFAAYTLPKSREKSKGDKASESPSPKQ